MRRFEKVLARSDEASLPNLTLPYDLRRKTRQLVRLDDGEEIGLLLAPGTVLKDGDILESTEGDRVRVAAAAEPILFVTASDSEKLARAAYHLGNRHIPVEIGTGFLRLEADPVLMEMLKRIDVSVEERKEAFNPESGAYGGGHRHGHDESFSDDYRLAQEVFHEHEHEGNRGTGGIASSRSAVREDPIPPIHQH
jgi:urease accessory protein